MSDGRLWFNTKIDNSTAEKDLKELKRKIQKSTEEISKAENAKLPLIDQLKTLEKELDAAKAKLNSLKQGEIGQDFVLADGSLDVEKIEKAKKELTDVSGELSKINKKLDSLNSKRMPLADDAARYGAELDAAKSKLLELENIQQFLQNPSESIGTIPAELRNPLTGGLDIDKFLEAKEAYSDITEQIKAQKKEVSTLEKKWESATAKVEQYDSQIKDLSAQALDLQSREAVITVRSDAAEELQAQASKVEELQYKWDSTSAKVEKYDSIIQRANTDINRNTAAAAQLGSQFSYSGSKMKDAFNKATASAKKFEKRLASMVKRAFVFSVIYSGLRKIRDYMSSALSTNAEYTAQLAKLKGALLTAFQPIYEYILPGVIAVLDVLTQIVQAAAVAFSAIAGKTAEESAASAKALYEEVQAINDLTSAANSAKKSLAGFDEINRLISDESAASASSVISPDFSIFETTDTDTEESWLDFTGAAFDITDDLKKLWEELSAVFEEKGWKISASFENIALVLWRLRDAFSVFNFADGAISSTADSVSWLIDVFHGLTEFLAGVFTGDWKRAWDGIRSVEETTANFIVGILENLKVNFNAVIDWLQSVFLLDWSVIFGEDLGAIMNGFNLTTSDLLEALQQIFNGLIDFLQGMFTNDWEQVWNGLKDVVKGVLNGIISIINSVIRGAVDGINSLLRLLNFDFSLPNGKRFSVEMPQIKNTPQIPYLAQGAVLPANNPFLAVVGDQKHGTNVEAPLATIQEAVAVVMADMVGSQTAGFEAVVAVLQEILEAVLGIEIDGEVLSQAVENYQRKMAVVRGG